MQFPAPSVGKERGGRDDLPAFDDEASSSHHSFSRFGAIVGHLQQVEVRLALCKNTFAPPLNAVKKIARHGYIAVVHGKIWFYGYVVRLCMPLCGAVYQNGEAVTPPRVLV